MFHMNYPGLKEYPHSCLVAWLLEPNNPHGLGDGLLISFLEEARVLYKSEVDLDCTELKITKERAGESGSPDIVIEGKNFICVIENKIRSPEGLDQTKRYADDWEKIAAIQKIKNLFLVFLTPEGRAPNDKRFKPLSYPKLISMLEGCSDSASVEAKLIINQFVMNLRVNVLKEFSQEEKAQGIIDRCESGGEEYMLQHFLEIMETYKEVHNG